MKTYYSFISTVFVGLFLFCASCKSQDKNQHIILSFLKDSQRHLSSDSMIMKYFSKTGERLIYKANVSLDSSILKVEQLIASKKINLEKVEINLDSVTTRSDPDNKLYYTASDYKHDFLVYFVVKDLKIIDVDVVDKLIKKDH